MTYSATLEPYAFSHWVLEVTVTFTSCRALGWLPPKVVVPHPVTVATYT